MLEKTQEELIKQLCGVKYSRNQDRKFKRAGTAKSTLETRHGTVEFRLVKVKSMENGSIMRSFLTFARLVVKQVRVPYTNNLMERLMGEIAKRMMNR